MSSSGYHDTDGRPALQQIDRIETHRALHVDEVAEVPTHEVIVPRHGAGGDMPRVVGVFGSDDALREPGGGELIHFFGDIEEALGSEGTLEQVRIIVGHSVAAESAA